MKTLILTSTAWFAALMAIATPARADRNPDRGNLQQRIEQLEAAITELHAANRVQASKIRALERENASLAARLSEIADSSIFELAPYVSVSHETINLVTGPHILFEGVNVHIRSGSGATFDGIDASDPATWPAGRPLGRGNLIIGYNEPSNSEPTARSGSHTLVIGVGNSFTSSGCLVAGADNTVAALVSSVTGGSHNVTNGPGSTISGGALNVTNSDAWHMSIAGGGYNVASGWASSISGGFGNWTGTNSCEHVSGGQYNSATAWASCVTGGWDNHASGNYSTVTGGQNNGATETAAVVTSGVENRAVGWASSVTGGSSNTASANASTVGGGSGRRAEDDYDWAAGSLVESE